MNAVLIVEDQNHTRVQLAELLTETIGGDIQIFQAATIDESIAQTDAIWKLRPSIVVAIVDILLPKSDRGNPIVAEAAVASLAMRTNPRALIIFVSAFDQSKAIETWRSKYTSEPGSADSYFVSKNDLQWGDEVVNIIKESIYGSAIESLLDSLFGREAGALSAQRVGELRFVEANHYLEVLTARIRTHYKYLRPDLKVRVDKHFDVVDSAQGITAELL